ncbi:MAG: 6-phosphogluconolactonase [Anaerolineae bacterium]|nr:6-phosphogluconolactonase [Anaerolineae bacterium]MDK1117980.1 6-phosphogluconolactonase [Anaerolineae bacterium]
MTNADIRIFKDNNELSLAASLLWVESAREAINARGRFLVVLSGGNTPSGLYQLLAEEPYRSQIDWKKTSVFWGDERCVSPTDEASNYRQAMDILLRHVPILKENVHRIKGELIPVDAVNDYAQLMEGFSDPGLTWPRFDLVLLGMGADGHTASLFPNSDETESSPVLAVSAHYQGRPAQRVTLSPHIFNSARTIIFLVTGEDKADVLKSVLNESHMPKRYPAQRIQPKDGKIIWLLDEAAGSKIT